MKKIVITGANGFVGKNLLAHLSRLEDVELNTIVKETKPEDYASLLKDAEIIFHLAGVNRPEKEEEFKTGNTELTEKLLEVIGSLPKNQAPKFIITSSTQAENDNPYGKSKLGAEQLVINAANEGIVKGVIYRLPGVFGKWSKPNYNSVISTFCHNVANGLELEVRDRNYSFPVVYIDDVIADLNNWIEMEDIAPFTEAKVRTQFDVSLGFLSDTISSFPKSRQTLFAPKVGDTLTKYLYSTYLSYLPKDKFSYPMELKVDNRGDLFEWLKSEQFGQIFVSTTKPGITRGNHFHHTKTEKFLVIRGEAIIRLRKIDETEVVEYPVSGKKPTVVDIPTGYTHNITNTGQEELVALFWANEIFDQERTDTYFLEV